jgi:hypothetical protein
MSDSRQESPQKCPKCSNTENLTVAVTSVPDRESTWGGRVVWDNNTATTCGDLRVYREGGGFRAKGFVRPGARGGATAKGVSQLRALRRPALRVVMLW